MTEPGLQLSVAWRRGWSRLRLTCLLSKERRRRRCALASSHFLASACCFSVCIVELVVPVLPCIGNTIYILYTWRYIASSAPSPPAESRRDPSFSLPVPFRPCRRLLRFFCLFAWPQVHRILSLCAVLCSHSCYLPAAPSVLPQQPSFPWRLLPATPPPRGQ